MKIIIKSVESGWETERVMELPEDEALVKSILRAVIRRTQPKASAQPPASPPEQPKMVEGTDHRAGYSGFLMLECPKCGEVRAFNPKQPVTELVCRKCGQVTELEHLAVLEMACPSCGKTWGYRTNIEEPEIVHACIACGGEMASRWDKEKHRYVPKEPVQKT